MSLYELFLKSKTNGDNEDEGYDDIDIDIDKCKR